MRRVALLAAIFAASQHGIAAAQEKSPNPVEVASKLAGAALVGGRAWTIVQSLTDKVGPRLGGSPGAERAVEWAMKEMRAVGLKNVRKEPVKVRRWVRGAESVELLAPAPQKLAAVALGGSIATPSGGIAGEVVEVGSFDELKALGARVAGKIVLFNKPMLRTKNFEGYGAVVGMRGRGAIEASRLGAAAALIRSVGTGSFRLPHTGGTRYDDKVPAIPFAAVAAEDADLIHRLLAAREKVEVRLKLEVGWKGEVQSANVVGEIPGREKTEELVLIGAHLDSWDLGTGALDDAAGCAIVLETARLFATLGPPRRTVRVVLFMNEELGLSGAFAYAEQHQAELPKHVAALEADSGAGRPFGYAVAGGAQALALIRKLQMPFAALHLDDVIATDEAGADLIPLQRAGVPVLAVTQDMSHYFDWHHTAADTLDKVDAIDLALNVAAFAWITHALAESRERLPPPPPPTWNPAPPAQANAPSPAPAAKPSN